MFLQRSDTYPEASGIDCIVMYLLLM